MLRSRPPTKIREQENNTPGTNQNHLVARSPARAPNIPINKRNYWNFLLLAFLVIVWIGLVHYLGSTDSGIPGVNEYRKSEWLPTQGQNPGPPPPPLRRLPLVDRSILERIEQQAESHSGGFRQSQWPRSPPLVTRIPEPTNGAPYLLADDALPQRFLLPIRIAEQESKARGHLIQLLYLAAELNRTLVLPQVGKSRLGLCYEWEFGVYYDLDSTALQSRDHQVIAMATFVELMPSRGHPHNLPTGQILSLSANKLPRSDQTFSSKDLTVQITQDLPKTASLPRCFNTIFPRICLTGLAPLHIAMASPPSHWGSGQPPGKKIGDMLSRRDIQEAMTRSPKLRPQYVDPDVLLVSWDLRHNIFLESPQDRNLEYSPRLEMLAMKLAPPDPYLAIHWRMETVAPEVLPDCAYALIDKLTSLLHGGSLGDEIYTVWFASDYPVGAVGGTGDMATVANSGTFKSLTYHHMAAMRIVQDAFEHNGVLSKWKLTGLDQKISVQTGAGSKDLLEDIGIRGIVDKLIVIQSQVFVGGMKTCSRASSFTKQIIVAREKRQSEIRDSPATEVVHWFG